MQNAEGMSKEQREALDTLFRNGPLDIGGDHVQQREIFTRMLTSRPLPEDVVLTPGRLGDIPVLEIDIDGVTPDGTLLWFHGGFYVFGSARTSAGLASNLARRTRTRVILVDYRLAPEHPFPAAPDDALAAYRALLGETKSGNPARIAVVGESAGAGLAGTLLVRAREQNLPMPAAGVLFSPYADLTLSGASMTTKIAVDPSFTPDAIAVRAKDYTGAADPADPLNQPGVREPAWPAAAADPGRVERAAARRRGQARGARGRGRRPGHTRGHPGRPAPVPGFRPDARRRRGRAQSGDRVPARGLHPPAPGTDDRSTSPRQR